VRTPGGAKSDEVAEGWGDGVVDEVSGAAPGGGGGCGKGDVEALGVVLVFNGAVAPGTAALLRREVIFSL